jgi:predicted MFS family arabinose efflux permease
MGDTPGNLSPGRPVRDLLLLYAAAFLRALSTGLIGVLLGIYLAKFGFHAAQIGYVISAGLAGAACATLLVTLAGDRFGRKRALVGIAVLGATGGLAASVASNFSVLLASAFLGMLNGK